MGVINEDDFTVRNQTERTREIGTRMAIGNRGRDVLTRFLVESIVMSILGGAIGIGVGFAGASLIGRFTSRATTISPETVVPALVFSAAVGIFFGWYPGAQGRRPRPHRSVEIRVEENWAVPGFRNVNRGLHIPSEQPC